MDTTQTMSNINLLPHVYQFWDENKKIAIPANTDVERSSLNSQLSQIEFVKPSKISNELVLGKGNSDHWVRFCLTNPSQKTQELVLAASPAVMAEVDFYPQKPGIQSFQTGNSLPMNTRDIYSPEFHFNIVLQGEETQVFYMRLTSRTNAYLIAAIWDKQTYLIAKDRIEGLDGVLAGILIGLIFYTMLLYFSVRQSSSLLYILWSASTLILLASIDGRVLQYIFPNRPILAYGTTVLFYPLTVFLSAVFAQQFTRLKEYPRLNKIGWIINGLFFLTLVIAYTNSYALYFKVCALFIFIVIMYFGLITPIYSLVDKRSVLAKYLLISQTPLIVCVLDRSLFAMSLTSQHYIPYTAKTGLVAEMILLAYCIGLTIYKDKDDAQKLSLEQLRLSNELKSNYNVELEAEIARNTAEIRGMNTDLEQQAQQLIELDEAKSKFFANISHEFRTPLTLIQGPLSRLLEEGDTATNSQTVIQSSIRHSQELQNLIDQLLTLSKFDAKSLSLKTQSTNISNQVKSLTTQFSSLAESKNIELIFQTTTPLLTAFIDQDKFRMMLNNLLSNAMKFTDNGGRIEVNVSATVNSASTDADHASDEYVQIQVNDTGHGIPRDELGLVFDRYYQSESSAQAGSGRGTGIGLALVKELVSLHAGEVSVTSIHQSAFSTENASQESTGTSFSIRLPLGQAHLSANEIIDSAPDSMTASFSSINHKLPLDSQQEEKVSADKNAETILIVDDNDDMRAYIRSVLAPLYNIVEAVDGLDAEAALAKSNIDLVVTDLMMPKRDGLELVKSLKANDDFAKLPVVMLTAKAGLDDRLKGLIAAVDDYLAKPFDARELQICVQNLLTKHAQFKTFYQSPAAEVANDDEANSDDQYLQRLRAIVDNRLKEADFGVTELASEMHVSKATLSRQLNSKYAFTPSAFIRQCRLEKARQLSEQGEIKTTAELAYAVGFNQPGYFSKLYKKAFNVDPLEISP